MTTRQKSQRPASIKRIAAAASALALGAMVSTVVTVALSGKANAKPEFSQQTGYPCGQCHTNPAGGGKLKAYGEKFKANGFKK
jgi:hypothetical protein